MIAHNGTPHIPLAGRKAFYGRLVYLEARRPEALAIKDAGAEPLLKSFTEAVYSLTEQEIVDSNNAVPLDTYLQQLANNLTTHAQTLPSNHAPLFSPILETVQARLGGICCRECTREVNVCDGGTRDDGFVSQPGHCVMPLYDTFKEALAATIEYYSRYGTLVPKESLPEIIFSTGFCHDKPHDDPIDSNVGGKTTYLNNGRDVSQIQLTICVKKFNWKTYVAVPYILFHECICHAFQDIVPAQPKRLGSEPRDRFAEGWMDFVAYEIMKEFIEGKKDVVGADLKQLRTEQVDVGKQFHDVRVDHELIDKSRYAIRRAFGKETANRVLYLFERLPKGSFSESHFTAWEAFLRLSFDLNMLRMERFERERLIGLLYKNLTGRDKLDTLARLEPLPELMRKYLQDNDIRALVDAIFELDKK